MGTAKSVCVRVGGEQSIFGKLSKMCCHLLSKNKQEICINNLRCFLRSLYAQIDTDVHTFIRLTVYRNENILNFQRPPGSSPVTGPTCWSCLLTRSRRVATLAKSLRYIR